MRAMARLFDGVVAMILALAVPGGSVLAAGYLLLSDGFAGQSLGKRLVGIKVINWRRRQPAGRRESILRNWPMAAVALLVLFGTLGWLLVTVGGTVLVLAETWRAFNDEHGFRLGDVMADTQVIDASVPIHIDERVMSRRALTTVPGQVEATP